ncbi:hypothetical protein EGI26_09740 [Lacihabitans sp. CCS-44]|uniref:hypothetical protein n=1 Tax=Lacihabitans sp. CCS-44 TaxID=2487331 RepID=UPI0020CBBCF0|nr:hypothetical protein [Lacihabitans sp. CCS-44]MCP9755434.1 hypothetical protein [Lacihabitans sp. CCS-44]
MKTKINIKKYLALAIALVNTLMITAQPNMSTKKVINDLTIYQDFLNKKIFYFAPGHIKLVKEANGKPKFSLLSMRYTGTSATGNSGDKRFTNLVQFTVQLESPKPEVVNSVKQSLGGNGIQLRSFPVKNIENNLVAFFNDKEKEIAKSSGIIEEKTGSSESFWTERSLNFRLSNEDAQLLIDQIEHKKCALSFNYAFWGDCVNGVDGTVNITGTKRIKPIEISAEIVKDTTIRYQVVSSDILQIELDHEKFPDLIEKIDLNEEVPPAYALLEARCYDFYDNLRPDLFMKTLEIQAVGVNGKPVLLPAKRFTKNKPDVFSIQIQFPFAVRMYQPFKYRVTEYLSDGKRLEGQWIEKASFTELIDITTPLDLNKYENKSLEFELENEGFIRDSVATIEAEFSYFLNEKTVAKLIKFDDSQRLLTNILFDKNHPLLYAFYVSLKKGGKLKTESKELIESYLYIKSKDIFDNLN